MGDDLTIRPPGSSTRKTYKVKKIATHPNYNPYTLQNDIAVLIVWQYIFILSKFFNYFNLFKF